MSGMAGHLSLETLLDYWLGDSDAASTERIDEHLVRCDACGAALDGLVVLGGGIRDAFRAGRVPAVLSASFLERLATEADLRLREYRLEHNGSVNCTLAPDDDLLVSRLAAPLQGVQRLDIHAEAASVRGASERLEDVPFDAERGEVLFVPRVADIRQMPAHDLQVRLLAVEPGGERELGRYTFHHRPWPGA